MKEFIPTCDRNQGFEQGRGEEQALSSTRPPCGVVQDALELPLSNKLISVRDGRKKGVKDTTGELEIYPSMAVRKRDYSEFEESYYAMIARYGKKSREGGSRRGKIDHFSNDARIRLLKKLGSIGREDPPFMVTLTYRSGSVTFAQAKKDLTKYRKRLDREFGIKHETRESYISKDGLPAQRKRLKYEPKWSGVWRFEVTTGRGKRAKKSTPHFHILVWCDEWHSMDLNELDYTLSKAWCEVTGDGGEDRMKYGCRLDISQGDQTRIKNYMLGHHGKKTDQEAVAAGRHWGIMNEEKLLIGKPMKTYKMTAGQRKKYDRITAKLIASRSQKRARDLSDLKETHTVLSPFNIQRLMRYLGVTELAELGEIELSERKFKQMQSA